MPRYPVSGSNTVAISPATASSNQLIGPGIASGRTLWIRSIWFGSNATLGPLMICDATVGSTATGATIALDMVDVASAGTPNVYNFNEPGVKFTTNPVAMMYASGSIAIGQVGYSGYEV